jgi:hypothetical protein
MALSVRRSNVRGHNFLNQCAGIPVVAKASRWVFSCQRLDGE